MMNMNRKGVDMIPGARDYKCVDRDALDYVGGKILLLLLRRTFIPPCGATDGFVLNRTASGLGQMLSSVLSAQS